MEAFLKKSGLHEKVHTHGLASYCRVPPPPQKIAALACDGRTVLGIGASTVLA